MLMRALGWVRYGILVLKLGGVAAFFHELKRGIYSTDTYIGVEMDLDTEIVQVPSKVKYSLRVASEADMREVFRKMKSESKKSTIELIIRQFFYESGFHNCYVARTADTNELCYVTWMLTSKDNDLASHRFGSRFSVLKENEVLLAHRYTFEKYRGNKIAPSVDLQLCEMARKNGFEREIGYSAADNLASLKASETAGHKPFETIRVRRLLFVATRERLVVKPLRTTQ